VSLVIERVGVDLDGATILDDVSLELAAGETVAVLGPSGGGKSTLLRVIAGLQPASRGRVVLDGRDLTTVPAHRRGVGLMFQDHALFPHRDVAANVAFGLRMRGASRPEMASRVGECLELVGLAGFDRRDVGSLSGGERQRVALARALAPGPDVLLLDEPLGSLDRALRDRLLDDLVAVIRAAAATVLHVTHDRAEAFAVGERIAVLRDGRLGQVGTPHELWWRPRDEATALLVGPAAVVDGVVDADGAVVSPWGPLAVAGPHPPGPVRLVVRPDAVVAADAPGAPSGPRLVAQVRGRTFRGDHDLVRLGVGDVELLLADRGGDVGLGATLEVVVVPSAVIVLPAGATADGGAR